MRRAVPRTAATLIAWAILAGCAPVTAPRSAAPVPVAGSASPTAPAGTSCPTFGVRLPLASDRLVDVELAAGPDSDRATFRFDGPGPDDATPAIAAEAILGAASPPFSQAADGSVFDVSGTRFAEIRFIGMTLTDGSGQATFRGPRDTETEFPVLRQLTVYEEAAGVIAWAIGLDGGGCVTLVAAEDGTLVLGAEHR